MKQKLLIVISLLLVFSACLIAEIPDSVLLEAIALHDTANTSSPKDAEKCLVLLKPYIDESPMARAYYGSAVTITAGYQESKNAIKALSLLEEGSTLIDEAVNMDSENPEVRLLRLANGIAVSSASPFYRYSVIKNDVDWFLESDKTETLPDDEQAMVYLNCGLYELAAENLDDALDLFDMAVEISPKSDSGKQAQKLLRRYEE